MQNKKNILTMAMFALAVILITFGILFLLTAAELVPIFKGFYNINNVLGRYVIVIITMASGIMLFSNLSATIKNNSLRNGMLIGITTFSTILTLPLVYVFVAIFFAQNGIVGPVGKIMMINNIVIGFNAIFGSGVFIYFVYSFMFILSIVFIAVPLVTGFLNLKGKTLIIGKKGNGKFGFSLGILPVLKEKE